MPDLANGQYVSQADADRQWWPVAREVLIEVAREYGAWITHDELSQRIQASTGITTRQPLQEWIGRVLGKVAADADRRGEPQLASLCVSPELTVGKGYPGAAADADERTREQAAAADRFACYRWHGATMPLDGGAPTLTPGVRERLDRPRVSRRSAGSRPPSARAASPRAASPRPALREVTCPHCFMVVPAAPTCRDCGDPLPETRPA